MIPTVESQFGISGAVIKRGQPLVVILLTLPTVSQVANWDETSPTTMLEIKERHNTNDLLLVVMCAINHFAASSSTLHDRGVSPLTTPFSIPQPQPPVIQSHRNLLAARQ